MHQAQWQPTPVAVSMLPRNSDPVLRFFEVCRAYRKHEDATRRWLVSGLAE
jgi:multiple inositol-polyphosphate phosphatase/2,3-bisphosphoglycerate 3-phosphatase